MAYFRIDKNILFLITFWFYSCATHSTLFDNHGENVLKKSINALIINSGLDVNMSIKVTSLESGATLYSLNSNKKLIPASNNKLYTCAASLANLGAEYTFQTSIYESDGNLYLKGGGDPDFSLLELDSLAQIVSSQIKTIDTIFIDESLMDSLYYGQGWMWDEGSWWYSAPVSAISLNNNCINFFVRPGDLGKAALISTEPITNFIKIDNQSITVNDTIDFKKFKITRDWANRTNKFTITGEKLINELADTLVRNIVHPPLFAGTVLKQMLIDYGTSVNQVSIGKTSESAVKITTHTSNSLFYSAKNMMNQSDNLTAELFVKTIGIKDNLPGNWREGVRKIKSFLADSASIDTADIRIADGSGMSRYNLTNANNIIKLLSYMYHSQYKETFLELLSGKGEKAITLDHQRLHKINPQIFARTGTLSGVSCLSGYVFSSNYGPLAFSILMNGYIGSSSEYRNLQDDILGLFIHD